MRIIGLRCCETLTNIPTLARVSDLKQHHVSVCEPATTLRQRRQ